MRLKKEVSNFSASCEHLMAEVETSRTLTEEETLLVEFYCREVLKKIVKRPPSQGEKGASGFDQPPNIPQSDAKKQAIGSAFA